MGASRIRGVTHGAEPKNGEDDSRSRAENSFSQRFFGSRGCEPGGLFCKLALAMRRHRVAAWLCKSSRQERGNEHSRRRSCGKLSTTEFRVFCANPAGRSPLRMFLLNRRYSNRPTIMRQKNYFADALLTTNHLNNRHSNRPRLISR